MDVRQLEVDDIELLKGLFTVVLPAFTEQMVDERGPARFLGDPTTFAFGAWIDGEPAGLAWGIQMPTSAGRLVTYLHDLLVREQFRRRGIASGLVTESMALARSLGSTRFWLSTGRHNEIAQSLYGSLGGVRKPLGDVNFWWELEPSRT